jgi:hypothetical protein
MRQAGRQGAWPPPAALRAVAHRVAVPDAGMRPAARLAAGLWLALMSAADSVVRTGELRLGEAVVAARRAEQAAAQHERQAAVEAPRGRPEVAARDVAAAVVLRHAAEEAPDAAVAEALRAAGEAVERVLPQARVVSVCWLLAPIPRPLSPPSRQG